MIRTYDYLQIGLMIFFANTTYDYLQILGLMIGTYDYLRACDL